MARLGGSRLRWAAAMALAAVSGSWLGWRQAEGTDAPRASAPHVAQGPLLSTAPPDERNAASRAHQAHAGVLEAFAAARLIARSDSGPIQPANATAQFDANGDGTLDARDVDLLLRAAVSLKENRS